MFDFKGVRMQNVGLFQDQKLVLPRSRLVALVGPNGTGKTTALECLAAAAYRMLDGRSSDIWSQYRERLAMRVSARTDGTPRVCALLHEAEIAVFPDDNELGRPEKYADLYRRAPLVVRYYPITRGFAHRPRRLKDDQDRLPGPRDIDATAQSLATPAQHLKQWLVNQYFLRHEPDYGPQHQRRFHTFVQILQRGFGELNGRPYIGFDRVGRDFEVWFRTPAGPARLEDLAAGVQSQLAIIADLAIHLDSAYPESPDSLKEPALVLIDELELHLHPAWQQNVAQMLLELFPGTRFIISTHSPLVVNDCGARSILLFHFDENGRLRISPYTESMQGWLAEQIYVRAFGMPSSRNPDVQRKLDDYLVKFRKYLQHRQDGEHTAAAELHAALAQREEELKQVLPPGDPALEMLRFGEMRRTAEGPEHG